MPALSKQQQKLFGLALAVKRGDVPKGLGQIKEGNGKLTRLIR